MWKHMWKRIQDHTQYLLNRDHQHHKWLPQKSWTWYQGFQDVQDKQQLRYPLTPRSKWTMHQRYKKIPKSECPDIWTRLPRHKWPKSWSSMEDPVVPLERNLYGHPLAGLLWERQLGNILLKHGWEKIPNWECLFVHREKGLFLSVYVDDIKLAGKKQNLDPMWKVMNKEVAISPVRSAACTSTSLRVLAAVDRSTELKCCGPFVPRCK